MRIVAAVAVAIIVIIAAKATAFVSNQLNARRGGDRGHRSFFSDATTARSLSSSPLDEHSPRDGGDRLAADDTMEAIRSRLAANGMELPPPGGPKANYQLVHRDGDLLYLSGHLPMRADGTLVVGSCAPLDVVSGDDSGKWLTTEQGYDAARHCALNLLSTLQSYLSTRCTVTDEPGDPRPADLSHVAKIVKLFGIVRSHPDFMEQHLVMNGASDALGTVLGEDVGACHAKSAIGTNSLPLGICVEVEMIAKISVC